jgi:low affinity Fe/Cu permease
MHDLFRAFAARISVMVGSAGAFVTAILIVVVWAALGPVYHYSDTWQLVINTGTTIITFLMVFLIQNMQNRDAKAIHLKLDELLKGVKGARTELVNLEDLSDKDLDELQKEFATLRERYAARALERRQPGAKTSHPHAHKHPHAEAPDNTPAPAPDPVAAPDPIDQVTRDDQND